MRFVLLFLLIFASTQPLLAQTASVEGRVIDAETGEPMANVPVDLRSVYNTTPRVWRTTHTDAAGRFVLEDLPNETPHRIRAVVAGPTTDFTLLTPPLRPDSTKTLTFAFNPPPPATRSPRASFIIDASVPPNVVTGTVYDHATSLPIPNATVVIGEADAQFPNHIVTTDADGHFHQNIDSTVASIRVGATRRGFRNMAMLRGAAAQRGRYAFFLPDEQTESKPARREVGTISTASGAVMEDALRLRQSAPNTTLSGRVMRGDLPAAGAKVALLGSRHTAEADADGRFLLANVEPALYRFRITHGSTEETTPQLLLTRGPNDFTFTLDTAEN